MALIFQVSDCISFLVGAASLGLPVGPRLAFGAFPAVTLMAFVPVSWSGFGVRENLTALAYEGTLTWDQAVAAGLIVDLLEYVVPAIFGVIGLRYLLSIIGSVLRRGDEAPG